MSDDHWLFSGETPKTCRHANSFASRSLGFTAVCLECGARRDIVTGMWVRVTT